MHTSTKSYAYKDTYTEIYTNTNNYTYTIT